MSPLLQEIVAWALLAAVVLLPMFAYLRHRQRFESACGGCGQEQKQDLPPSVRYGRRLEELLRSGAEAGKRRE